MATFTLIVLIVVLAIVVVGAVGLVALLRRRPQPPVPPRPDGPVITRDEAASLADPETTDHGTVDGIPPASEEPAAGTTTLERPESAASRLVRLRQRLARSQSGLGRGLLALLSRDRLDDDTWEDIEDTLITADVGVTPDPGAGRAATHPAPRRGRRRRHRAQRPPRRAARPWSTRRWTAGSASPASTASPASCSWWGSTAPARPPRWASWPGSWSRRTRACSSVPPTPSGPRRPSSSPPGATGSGSTWSAAPRAATRPAWRSRRSVRASSDPPTW